MLIRKPQQNANLNLTDLIMVVKGSLTLLAVDDSVNMLHILVLCVIRRLRQAERDPPFADS